MYPPRLTPYLRRRVLSLPVADRVELMAAMGASINQRGTIADRFDYLRRKMESITGLSMEGDRNPARVRARSVLCFIARREGFSLHEIGGALGIDHSTAFYLSRKMENALALPEGWRDYVALYDKYTNAITEQ